MAEQVNWGSIKRGHVPTGATQHVTVSVGPDLAGNAGGELRKSQVRPATAPFAMSSPDRRSPRPRSPSPSPGADGHVVAPPRVSSPSPPRLRDVERPQTAPGLRAVSPRAALGDPNVFMQHGRLSLFDAVEGDISHNYMGPRVLRDYSPSKVGPPVRPPEHYLKQGDGRSLRARNALTHWLKRNPVHGREPPFVKGSGGVVLDWSSVPRPSTIFRYLYDNGTIDFVCMRWGGLQNHIQWGRRVRAGQQTWSPQPAEVEVAKWLPIFLEGVREYDEPYRFLAIRGAEALMTEATTSLHECAADCVPPLRKALESREPTAVAIGLELMAHALRSDPAVASVWIYHLWQFAQIMNLFASRAYKVDMGYNSREIASIRALVFDILIMLEEGGGEHATALVRRYIRVDPAVTDKSMARRADKERSKEGFKPWTPFTLF